MTAKRLFIFAGFDPKNSVVDNALVMYVRALSELGDVVLYMDNNLNKSELGKLKNYTLYAGAHAHGEYDFGSYKYAYLWARDNKILKDYKWVYLVNDSVYAPLGSILPILENLESANKDASGIVFKAHSKKPHLQSWFVGLSKKIFMSNRFDSFITDVKKQNDKSAVTRIYEQGLTNLLNQKGWSYTYAYSVRGHGIYNNIRSLFKRGLPFLKKVSFVRKHGALGRQVSYILDNIDTNTRDTILRDARRVYGSEYIDKFLTKNILEIAWRSIKHLLSKGI